MHANPPEHWAEALASMGKYARRIEKFAWHPSWHRNGINYSLIGGERWTLSIVTPPRRKSFGKHGTAI